MRFLAVVFLLAAVPCVGSATPQLSVEDGWLRCVAAPTRTCVFARAQDNVRATTEPFQRLRALARLAQGESEAGLHQEALRTADELFKFALTVDHDEERQGNLAIVAKVRARASEFVSAKTVLSSLQRDYYISVVVQSIATEFVRHGRTAEAIAMMRDNAATRDSINTIREFAWDVRDLVVARGEEAGVVALLAHAQVLEDERNEKEPFRFFTGIHHPSEFVPPLMIIVAAEARAGKIDPALTIVRAMQNKVARAQVRSAIGAILACRGRTDEALSLAHDVADAEERAEVLSRLFAPHGWEAADELLGKVTPDAREPATRAFDVSMHIASSFASENERNPAYALVAVTNAESGAVDNAARAAALVTLPSPKPTNAWIPLRVWLAVGEAQARSGARAEALASFARAQHMALQDTHPASLLSTLAQSEADAGFIDEALAVVERMRGQPGLMDGSTSNGKPIDYDRLSAINAIAKAMAKVGRTAEAMKLARETVYDGGQYGNGLGVVAEGLTEAGKIDEALVAAKAEPSGFRDNLLLRIIQQCIARGRIEDARKLRAGITRDVEIARALVMIATAQFKANTPAAKADGLATVSEALRLAATMQYPNLALDILVDAGRILPSQ